MLDDSTCDKMFFINWSKCEHCNRKVAAVSGDARRALALCSRALELASAGAGAGRAGLGEVERALAEAASSAVVRALKACSPAERLMLRAVAAEVCIKP